MAVVELVASEIIDEARDFHPGFDPRTVPDRVALRFLSRITRRLASRVTLEAEDALISKYVISAADLDLSLDGDSLADPVVEADSGVLLPAHLYLSKSVHVKWEDDDKRYPVTLTHYHGRYSTGAFRFPSGAIFGGRFYPMDCRRVNGSTGGMHGWEEAEQVELMMVRVPSDLTQMDDLVGIHSVCRDALVTGVALAMAGRTPGSIADLPTLKGDAVSSFEEAVAQLASQDSGVWEVAQGGAE
jgi:hypothetical protein